MIDSWSSSSLLSIVVFLQLINIGAHQHECRESRCGDQPIQFPFRLRDGQHDHCGCPGFDLSCNDKNEILLHLPASPAPIQFLVNQIDYTSNTTSLSDPDGCIPFQLLGLNDSSISPFKFSVDGYPGRLVSVFNCSHSNDELSCPISAVYTDQYLSDVSRYLRFCTKLYDAWSFLPSSGMEILHQNRSVLSWVNPNCTYEGDKRNPVVTGVLVLPWVLLALVGAVITILKIYQNFRAKEEDYAGVKNFLEDYRALKPTRFSYADIKRITSNFKDKLGKGAHGAVYKGKLSDEILVAVKVLNTIEGDGKEFINEVATMAKIHHVNVVRLLGFCADGFHCALVYNFFPNGSLQKFMSPPDNKDAFLGWGKLQQITLGVAKGIEYLHHGCDQRILHFDINPHNVLLDYTLTPKITDFGLAKLCPKHQSAVSITAARGTLGYIAPEVLSRNFGLSRKFGNVSHKSDVYSFGMLLIEMVGGRKNTNTSSGENFDVLYPDWIHNLLEGRDVHIPIEEEGDTKIVKKLAIIGLWCIQWDPVNRPSMKTVVRMLEGEGDNLAPPANPFDTSIESTSSSAMLLAERFNMKLEMIGE